MRPFLFKTLTMHKIFKTQTIYSYAEQLKGYTFNRVDVVPMRFNTPKKPTLKNVLECIEERAEFYRVLISEQNSCCVEIADCGSKELAEQIAQIITLAGTNYMRAGVGEIISFYDNAKEYALYNYCLAPDEIGLTIKKAIKLERQGVKYWEWVDKTVKPTRNKAR